MNTSANLASDRRIPKTRMNELLQLITIADYAKRPLIVRGAPGGAKTEATRSYVRATRKKILGNPALLKEVLDAIPKGAKILSKPVEEQVYGYIDFRLTYFDPTDIKGFPLLDKEAGVARWLPPSSLPLQRMVDAGEIPARGMWGLEELANAPRATQAAIFQAVLDREVAGEPIAAGWCIVATSNSLSDMSVVNPMPAPLVSRFSHSELSISAGDWCDWAMNPNMDEKAAAHIPGGLFPDHGKSVSGAIHEKLVAYVKYKPEALHSWDPKNWVQDTPYCCPRSVEMLSDAMYAWDALFGGRYPLHLITSYIGTLVGNEFFAYLDIFQDLPTVDEVLANPAGAKVPSEASGIWAINTALARRASRENADKLFTYFARMPKQFEVAAIKDMIRANQDIQNCKAMTDHILKPENREIYLALAGNNN
jgi:hypothetical protein